MSRASSALPPCSSNGQVKLLRVSGAPAENIPEDQLRAAAAKESQAPTQGLSNNALATIDSLASSIEERKVSDGSSIPPSGLPQSLTPSTAALLQNVSDLPPGHQTSRLGPNSQDTAADALVLASLAPGDSLNESALGTSGQAMGTVIGQAQPGAPAVPGGQSDGSAASLPDAMPSQGRSRQDGPPASEESKGQPSGSRDSPHLSKAGHSHEAGMQPSPSKRAALNKASPQEAPPILLKRQRTNGKSHATLPSWHTG